MRPPGTHRRRPDRRTRRRDRASGEGARRTTRSGSGRRFRTSRARAGRGRPRARALRSPASSSSASNHRWRRWRRRERTGRGRAATSRCRGRAARAARRRRDRTASLRGRRSGRCRRTRSPAAAAGASSSATEATTPGPARVHGRGGTDRLPPLGPCHRGRRGAEREGGHLPFRAGDAPRPAADLRHAAQRGRHVRHHASLPADLRREPEDRIDHRAEHHLERRHPPDRHAPLVPLSVRRPVPDLHRLGQHPDQLESPGPVARPPPLARRLHHRGRAALAAKRLLPLLRLGPDTPDTAETSYTRIRAYATARRGLNLTSHWNAGAALFLGTDGVQDLGVPGLPLSPRVFPDAPGMGGSTTLAQIVDVRFDSRPNREYSDRGFFAELAAGVVEGLSRSPTYLLGRARFRALVPETGFVDGAARLDWNTVSSSGVPFYLQSTLGGAYLLRGFTEDRFIDRSAWTLELEQRIRVLQTHIYGVTADWRIDPFIAVGQVYGGLDQVFSHPRVTGGVGFRAWVHPNVVGRIDVATGGEGFKVYVEIGYPY